MEIRIQFKKFVLCVSFGHKTSWFEKNPFFRVTKDYYGKDFRIEWSEPIWPRKLK